jgi:type II secretory pathway pseudopilin PulG
MCVNKFEMKYKNNNNKERGAALAIAIIVVAILAVIAMTALAFSSTEARIAGSDLQRTQTFYATTTAMEKMTNDFSNLFHIKMRPTVADMNKIAADYPTEFHDEGFSFVQTLEEDTARLTEMRATQGLPGTIYPRVNIPDGPYAGLNSSIIPYKLSSTGTMDSTKTQVELEREFNNYLVPLFQFGIYSNEDLEFAPGTLLTFNGRIHSNRNIYALRNLKFFNRLSMAGEFIRDAKRDGAPNASSGNDQVWFQVNGVDVQSTKGSMMTDGSVVGGPNIVGSTAGKRGYYPNSPNGVANPNWETESVKPANGTANWLNGQVLTNTTGANVLKTPLELAGNSPAESEVK